MELIAKVKTAPLVLPQIRTGKRVPPSLIARAAASGDFAEFVRKGRAMCESIVKASGAKVE